MAARCRWGNETIRRRAMRLAEIDGVRWARLEEDRWTKVDELVPEADLAPAQRAAAAAQ